MKKQPTPQTEQKPKTNPREVLVNRLGYRGMEVLQHAELQYPNETRVVVEKLSELFSSGELNEEIDGGKLLMLFRSVGLNIRLPTKINVEQDGKFVSLSDKLSSKTQNSENDEA